MIVHFHGGPLANHKSPLPEVFVVGDTLTPIDPTNRVDDGRYRVTELVYSTLNDGRQHFEYAEAEWGDWTYR